MEVARARSAGPPLITVLHKLDALRRVVTWYEKF